MDELKDIISKLEARYGPKWFTYQPPGARPIILTENVAQGESTPPREFITYHCEIQVPVTDVLVVERYSFKLWGSTENPYWPGEAPVLFPETYMQGRVRWTPVKNRQNCFQIHSILGNQLLYNYGVPTVTPQQHEGFSLLKEYVEPRILVEPGQTFNLMRATIDTQAGYDPSPGLHFLLWFVAEVRGFFLAVPDHIQYEPESLKENRVAQKTAFAIQGDAIDPLEREWK